MTRKPKAHWTTHFIIAMLIIMPVTWFILAGGPIIKMISIGMFLGGVIGAFEFYTNKKWNFGEVTDAWLFRRMERKAKRRFEKD